MIPHSNTIVLYCSPYVIFLFGLCFQGDVQVDNSKVPELVPGIFGFLVTDIQIRELKTDGESFRDRQRCKDRLHMFLILIVVFENEHMLENDVKIDIEMLPQK